MPGLTRTVTLGRAETLSLPADVNRDGAPVRRGSRCWAAASTPGASAIPGDAQWALRTLDWIGRAENLVLVGPSGTGKSHLAEAIAHAAIDLDLRVSWFSLETLTATIARSRIDATTGKVVERIVRSELIVVDDIGLLPVGADEAEALYRLVDAAYEKRSLIVTSNLHPARFDTIFPKGLATAAVDRLLHHAHVIVTEGQSHRLTEALDGRGTQRLGSTEETSLG
ncbi:MAG: ATP-binding protein [Chloroflexi bacterium]|nr:ATP-binding protein [Chloroflexota bacterium]